LQIKPLKNENRINKTGKIIIIEDIFGEFGFRIRWSVQDERADFEVFEIAMRAEDNSEAFFLLKNAIHSPGDSTENIDEAEKYMSGLGEYDGCSDIERGQLHWCGPDGYKKHIALLEYIYKRAHELMCRDPGFQWGDTPYYNNEQKKG
jgi:hypothetical protein